MEEQKKTTQAQLDTPQQYEWRTKEGVPQIYTNFAAVSWTLFDVRFVLGQLLPEAPAAKNFIIEERGSVTCAWPEAKALRDILIGLVAAYEEVNGEIKQPKLPSIPATLVAARSEESK